MCTQIFSCKQAIGISTLGMRKPHPAFLFIRLDIFYRHIEMRLSQKKQQIHLSVIRPARAQHTCCWYDLTSNGMMPLQTYIFTYH